MLLIHKKVGETPLELLDRLRLEKPELKDETLSYAGRLDPVAEGEMLILIGEDENKKRAEYLGYDKEYVATFIMGASTDTGDLLGLITNTQHTELKQEQLEKQVSNLKHLTTQIYPWFSGKTVDGIKLFEHFKSGNTDIKRPAQKISIKKANLLSLTTISAQDTHEYIKESINKVKGDFRQKEALENWQNFFKKSPQKLTMFEIKLHVSSGTFIRALVEDFSFPVTLLKLKRTKILM